MRLILTLLATYLISTQAYACDIQYTLNVKTLGESVTIELRSGRPGNSKVIDTAMTKGGIVVFKGICPGTYFFAVGDENYVDVTPVEAIQENYEYRGEVRIQRRAGNMDKKKRKDL